MIQIAKPLKSPRHLATKGIKQTQDDRDSYDLRPDAYISGSEKFEFNENIYSSKAVKKALSAAQHQKCCYCECWLNPPHRSRPYGTVEHFRPKGYVRQSAATRVERPGYYWLAYDWKNLLLCCAPCNSTKGNFFPLNRSRDRARSHNASIESEQPLVINPAEEDPRMHIRFSGETPEPKTKKGRITIEILRLRESDEDRKAKLNVLRAVRIIAESTQLPLDQVDEARQRLEDACHPNAEYSAMARDFLDS